MPFTPTELAEMARADAEIESSFCITNEEIAFGRLLDRDVLLENMDPKRRKAAEYKRQYYEANKDKVAEYQRQYYEANKDKVAEYQRQYYEANKDKVAEYKRQYREANKDKVAEYQRQYYEANKDKVAEGKTAIRNLRAELRLSQKDFGAMFGVTQATVSHWENISAPAHWMEIVASHSDLSKE